MKASDFGWVLVAFLLGMSCWGWGYFTGKSAGIAETKARWRTQEFPAPESALWDKATYAKAVAEEVARQKEMKEDSHE